MTITDTSPCPCGSEITFGQCCAPIHKNHRLADTAEKLMRSRYSAFVIGDSRYLLKTWAKKRRPKRLQLPGSDSITWLGLTITDIVDGGINDIKGEVEFSARYHEDGQNHSLEERSVFRKSGNLWYYVEGRVEVKSDVEKT